MKIAILGYGIEGKAAAHYFARKGYDVTVCDVKKKDTVGDNPGGARESQAAVSAAGTSGKIHFRFGPRYLDSLGKFDAVFRSPGIPFLKKEFMLEDVRKKLTSPTKYFFEKCPCPIVGITGTKGKGTTAQLLFEIMKETYLKKKGAVFLGGNIGRCPLEFLDELSADDLVILELSSFQLQDMTQSPHIAVVLGITPDHMDYHRDMAEYIEAKKNIVRFQCEGDYAILDADNKKSNDFAKGGKAKILRVSIEKSVEEGGFLQLGKLILKRKSDCGSCDNTGMIFGEKTSASLVGEHNLKNILAAATAADLLCAPLEIITKVVREFKGLPHRLKFIKEVCGARFYDDSASTNPETAIAAVRAFTAPTILILGGSDKNADFSLLGEEIARRPNIKSVILMGETKGKIEQAIEKAVAAEEREKVRRAAKRRGAEFPVRVAPLELISAESYQEAFMVAKMLAQPGDTVLLSPACASFDMFTDYKERGEIFRDFVMEQGE